MEKEYYKNLAEKYFAGDITEAEISELAGWIRNNVQLSDWWEEEFENPTLTSLSPCATRCSHGSRRKSSMNLSASLIRNLPDVLREKLSFPLGQDGQL